MMCFNPASKHWGFKDTDSSTFSNMFSTCLIYMYILSYKLTSRLTETFHLVVFVQVPSHFATDCGPPV